MLNSFLPACAKHGRIILIAGLLAGIVFEDLAAWLRDYLPEMVALLLFLAAMRVGPKQTLGSIGNIKVTLLVVIIYQVVLPLLLLGVFTSLGWWGAIPLAIILMASAASIAGSANLVLLTGNDPAPALRLLIVGTAFLPITIIPVFLLLPELGSVFDVLQASSRLLVLIGGATLAAFVFRKFFMPEPSSTALTSIDGASALAMALVVVGLMSAMGPALRENPNLFAITLAAACTANFGLQIIAWFLFRRASISQSRVAFSVVAGNRNMALFLTSLPVAITDPLLLFIGCYQIPMYLTPVILGRLFKKSETRN